MIFEFKFPDVGEGVHEGKVLKLNFNAGDSVEEGDILAVVETDKVVAEIPSSKTGTLDKYGIAEGQIIQVGQVLAYIQTDEKAPAKVDDEDVGSVVGEIEGPKEGTVLPPSGEGLPDKGPESIGLVKTSGKVLATPLARKMAADHQIELSQIAGSGPGGRVLKADIQKAVSDSAKQATPEKREVPLVEPTKSAAPLTNETSQTVIEFSQLRKTIAKNMEESNRIPAFVIHDRAVVDDLVSYRRQINEGKAGVDRVSFIPFFMKALSAALKKHPRLNGHYDAAHFQLILSQGIHIGFAVNTDDGLIVPLVKNVESKSILDIHREMMALVEKAKNRTLSLDETRGGTFTITNYGPFGGLYGRPLIMPPQVGILGFGRIEKQPVVKEDIIAPAHILPLSLVADHRAVDGAPAGEFLRFYIDLLTRFHQMILHI